MLNPRPRSPLYSSTVTTSAPHVARPPSGSRECDLPTTLTSLPMTGALGTSTCCIHTYSPVKLNCIVNFSSLATFRNLGTLHSVLWRCWLGGRKGIRPVKTEWWGAGVVICLEQGADLHMCPSWCHCHSLSLASVKSTLVLPFLYRLTRVVPAKGPLNGCVWQHLEIP